MRHGPLLGALALSLAACGGGQTPASDPSAGSEACEVARLDAQQAWRALRREAESLEAPDAGPPLQLEAVVDRLATHLANLRESPREVDGEEALALANAVMDGLDEVAGEVPETLQRRADDAAEALLTERGARGSVRATSDVIAVLDDVIRQARPDRARARAQVWSVSELVRRAGDTADAYGRGVREGDGEASRAEDLPVPADVLAVPRARAADASREARERCGVARALAVPGPG